MIGSLVVCRLPRPNEYQATLHENGYCWAPSTSMCSSEVQLVSARINLRLGTLPHSSVSSHSFMLSAQACLVRARHSRVWLCETWGEDFFSFRDDQLSRDRAVLSTLRLQWMITRCNKVSFCRNRLDVQVLHSWAWITLLMKRCCRANAFIYSCPWTDPFTAFSTWPAGCFQTFSNLQATQKYRATTSLQDIAVDLGSPESSRPGNCLATNAFTATERDGEPTTWWLCRACPTSGERGRFPTEDWGHFPGSLETLTIELGSAKRFQWPSPSQNRPTLASLTTLKLTYCEATEDTLEHILSSKPPLKELHYSYSATEESEGDFFNLSTISRALRYVFTTLKSLTLEIEFQSGSDEVPVYSIGPFTGTIDSFHHFPHLTHLEIPFAVLTGWHHIPRNTRTLSSLLPQSLRHLCLTDDLADWENYSWDRPREWLERLQDPLAGGEVAQGGGLSGLEKVQLNLQTRGPTWSDDRKAEFESLCVRYGVEGVFNRRDRHSSVQCEGSVWKMGVEGGGRRLSTRLPFSRKYKETRHSHSGERGRSMEPIHQRRKTAIV